MLCPNCKTPLSIADRSGIEIDFCPTCRGIWLDRGELDKVIERSAASLAPAPEPPLYGGEPHRRPSHDHRHGRRKKSFLSDIFDFD